MMIAALLAALWMTACAPAQSDSTSSFEAEADGQFHLPDRLQEISGLAVTPDGRMFGHDDEIAMIYEINPNTGGVLKWFALGEPPQTGDFEGLTITPEGDFWLTDSEGRVFFFREGADEERAAFERFTTGVGETCEVEGIAYQPADQSLILACKRVRGGGRNAPTQLHSWSTTTHALSDWGPISADIAQAAGVRTFAPSGLELDPVSGRLIVISAADGGAIAELRSDGELISASRLSRGHRQAEGVAILPDGSLIIADEGGNDQAVITRYRRRQ